jgi:hypothetical protein
MSQEVSIKSAKIAMRWRNIPAPVLRSERMKSDPETLPRLRRRMKAAPPTSKEAAALPPKPTA